MFWRSAGIVDSILRGAKPSDIPVKQPTKFDLVINYVDGQDNPHRVSGICTAFSCNETGGQMSM
jgi:hypothetical protein